MSVAPLIVCSGVTVVHGAGAATIRALAGVDLEIRAGEHCGLLGPSGSGKTTLLHVLGGLISPVSGTIAWRGEELASLDQAARRAGPVKGIAYVFQGANLLPHFTAFENVARVIFWRWSGSRGRRKRCPPSSRAESSSAWRSPVRWPSGPSSCSAMSRPVISTPIRGTGCWT
jgi:putative ABC transport system ATP-binding protein